MTKKPFLRIQSMTHIALSVAILSICSWISIPLIVPVTLQTMGVFLLTGLLGTKRALAALSVYVLLGAIGLPVFSGFSSGFHVLAGPTGGYIIGFYFIVFCVDVLMRRIGPSERAMAFGMLLGLFFCYAFGTLWFQWIYARHIGPVGLWSVLSWSVFPFVLPDLIKLFFSLIILRRLRVHLKID